MTVTNPAIANNADDEQAVRKVIADYGDAWNKHDPDAILALFTDDADWAKRSGELVAWTGGASVRDHLGPRACVQKCPRPYWSRCRKVLDEGHRCRHLHS
jgi:hypothetical protein